MSKMREVMNELSDRLCPHQPEPLPRRFCARCVLERLETAEKEIRDECAREVERRASYYPRKAPEHAALVGLAAKVRLG